MATVSGNTVTIVGNGTSTIIASQVGNDVYSAATPVQQTLTVDAIIAPEADAFVRDGSSANANYGTSSLLTLKKDGTGYSREVYLKFNLNGINSFDNATLRLNISAAGTNIAATTWEVYYVPTDSWSETSINWNSKPASSTLLGTIQGKSSGWAEWNITNQALAELSGDKTLSLRIVSTVINSTADASFRSKEDNTDPALRPQLVLTSGVSTTVGASSNITDKKIIQQIDSDIVTVRTYPNPVKDILYIKFDRQIGSTKAQIFDIYGRMLLNQKLMSSNSNLNVSSLTAGLYLVKVFAGDKIISTMKIIKVK